MGFHETIAPDEGPRFERYGAGLAELQTRRVAKGGGNGRILHLKQHTGVVGELVVTASGAAQVGVFSSPGERWPVYVRFSSGGSARRSDRAPDVRGFALKLVGVHGRKIIPGLEQEVTQDFLFINDPSIPFRDPDEFVKFMLAAKDGPAKLLPRLVSSFGLRGTLRLMKRLVQSPKVASYATHTFHTGAPISFGKTAVKLALVPVNPPVAPPAAGEDYLRKDLVARLGRGPLSWSLRAQFFQDDRTTPIEDTSVTWSGPWTELGVLTIPRQDVESARGREISALVESLSFDPWHSLEAHRPLGAIMRARAVAYRFSVLARKAAPEPKTVIGV